jgi:hypothetical protein
MKTNTFWISLQKKNFVKTIQIKFWKLFVLNRKINNQKVTIWQICYKMTTIERIRIRKQSELKAKIYMNLTKNFFHHFIENQIHRKFSKLWGILRVLILMSILQKNKEPFLKKLPDIMSAMQHKKCL